MISLKKLIFAPCFLSLLASCGKKVESSNPNESSDESAVIVLPGDSGAKKLTITYSDLIPQSSSTSYPLKAAAWVRIPDFPVILGGNATMVATRVRFNVEQNSIELAQNEVYCDYLSIKRTVGGPQESANSNYDHHFKGCFEDVDNDGQADSLNFIPGDEIGVMKGRSVQIRVTPDSRAQDLVLESEIEVDYI